MQKMNIPIRSGLPRQKWAKQLRSGAASVLSIAALASLSACGGGGDSADTVAVATPPVDTPPAVTTPVVDKFPKVATPLVKALAIDKTNLADRNYPFSSVDFDLKPYGFVEEEFTFEGQASSYGLVMSGGVGNMTAVAGDAAVVSAGNPYRTRLYVIRPSDPAKFNGTVIYDWLNATSGYDINLGWFHMKELILRKGYAYVGATVQKNPVTGPLGLVQWNPNRYGTLDVTNGGKFTGEDLGWDIFAQGAKAVRAVPAVLGNLPVQKVIAMGGSQSGGRLGMYMNSVSQPHGNIFDGAILLYGGPQMRRDLPVPILKILTETEIEGMANETRVAVADTAKLKTWSIAGSAHADYAGFVPRLAIYLRDMAVNYGGASETCATPSRNRLTGRYIYNAALVRMEEYLNKGTPLPTSPAVPFTSASTPERPVTQRDADGLILGGIRTPDIDAATGVNTGILCGLPGSFMPFTKAKLDSLYATHDAYVAKVTASANKAVADGFMLAEDAQEAIDTAKASIYGRKLKCDLGSLCSDQNVQPYMVSSQLLRRHTLSYYVLDRAKLLAPVDDATYQIATGYNTTAPDVARLFFGNAIGSLEQYIILVRDQVTKGALANEAGSYLINEATVLIAALQKL